MTAAAPVNQFACWLIRCYQRRVSPYKGFRCAYGVLHGRDSCSRFAYRAIQRNGLPVGVRLTRRRFDKCRWASHDLEYDAAHRRRDRRERMLWSVNGCNPGLDSCDVAACAAEGAGELAAGACCEAGAAACHW